MSSFPGHLAALTLGRATLEQGWKWSTDVKPTATTNSCELSHSSVVVSGRIHIVTDDGREVELGAGDAPRRRTGPVVSHEQAVAVDLDG